MKNEYCDQIRRVLREFECYDAQVFNAVGGYSAYTSLTVLEAAYGQVPMASQDENDMFTAVALKPGNGVKILAAIGGAVLGNPLDTDVK